MIPVKLPQEVLDLFPEWEYRCPDCGCYVEPNVSFCPVCKTQFNEKKWRVPPRFLKNYEAMSEYAHKILAPKLVPEQRGLLFQYFTEFLNSGWEDSGGSDITDDGKWTDYVGSPFVVASPVHHGSYSVEFNANGEYLTATFTQQSHAYARCYVRWTTQPTSGKRHLFLELMASGSGSQVELYNNGGDDPCFRFLAYTSTWEIFVLDVDIDPDTWFCVEVDYQAGTANGAHCWIDGDLKATCNGTTPIWVQPDYVLVGSRLLQEANTINIDCVVVADTYIGPETTQQTHTKTWTSDALFKKLNTTKTISADTVLQKQDITETFGLDAAFQKNFSIQKQVDSVFKKFGATKDFVLDARFGALQTHTVLGQIDVLLKKLDVAKTFGLDAFFGSVSSETYAKSFGLSVIFAYKLRLPELWLDQNGRLVLNVSKPYAWVGL